MRGLGKSHHSSGFLHISEVTDILAGKTVDLADGIVEFWEFAV